MTDFKARASLSTKQKNTVPLGFFSFGIFFFQEIFVGDFERADHTISIVQHPENGQWCIAICEKCRDKHNIFTKGVHSCIQDYAKAD